MQSPTLISSDGSSEERLCRVTLAPVYCHEGAMSLGKRTEPLMCAKILSNNKFFA
jgi:hypothetical protein